MVDAGAAEASGLNDVKPDVVAYKIAADLAKGHPAAQALVDAAPREVDFRWEGQFIGRREPQIGNGRGETKR